MSSNVGLPTPRGSGTSGYIQRNLSFVKPRNAGYGAPYPPISSAGVGTASLSFKQRKPDRQILEHDRKRAIELKVLEEQERLEEENERIRERREERGNHSNDNNVDDVEKKDGEGRILSEEEIEQRCDALRQRLLRELEDEQQQHQHQRRADENWRHDSRVENSRSNSNDYFSRRRQYGGDSSSRQQRSPPKERRQFKSYQVHELAEAKIQESERLRKALGIKEDWERTSTTATTATPMEKDGKQRRSSYSHPGSGRKESR